MLSLLILFHAAFLFGACGKRRPPLPPTRRSSSNAPAAAFVAVQQGDSIVLKIPLAPALASQTRQIDVYRLAQNSNPNSTLYSEEEFAERSTLIGSVAVDSRSLSTNQSNVFTYADKLNALKPDLKLNYAVRLIGRDERSSSFSSLAIVEPNFKIARAPLLKEVSSLEKAVTISWQKPLLNIDESAPPLLVGYNLYRENTTSNSIQKLNSEIINDTVFEDTTFAFNSEYQYFVRAVAIGKNDSLVESSDSNKIKIKPVDKFPPAPPQGLTVAAAARRLSLFFAANLEPDLAGYNIYRSTDKNLPLNQWKKLNPALLTATTFQDLQVEAGQTYFYYLTAVDQTGNISEPSQIVSEIVP